MRQNRTGQDRTGQDRTGQDRTGQETTQRNTNKENKVKSHAPCEEATDAIRHRTDDIKQQFAVVANNTEIVSLLKLSGY